MAGFGVMEWVTAMITARLHGSPKAMHAGRGRRFPGKKACNHSLPRRPLVASAAKGDSRHRQRGTADLNKKQREKR